MVQEGDAVEKGAVLANIDKRDLMAQKAQLEANIAAIQAQQMQAAALTEMQRQTLNAALAQAKSVEEKARADLELCRSDYRRYSELVQSGAVSQKVFEEYQTKFNVAEAAFAQSAAAVEQAQAALLQTNVNLASEKALEKNLAQAQAALDQLEVSLDETEIRAPFDGIITAKYVEEGSMISQGTPLVAIQDPRDNWVDLKIPETQLKDFRLNQKLELVARDGVTKVTGTITDISHKAEFAMQRATSERGSDADIISFNVKIQTNDSAMIFGLPVAFTVLFGLVYRENVVNRITLAVCDEEQSALSRNLISMYADSEKFQIVAHVTSEEELRQENLEGRAKSALLIPKNFSREIKLGRGAEILFMVNSANNFFGNAALSAVQEITKTFSTAVSQKLFEGQNLLPAAAMSAAYPIRLGVRILGNPTSGYSPFMLSGLLLNGVQIGIMITILPVFNEEFARRKSGEKFWLAAKLLLYEVLSLAGYAVSLILMVNFFAVPMRGSWLEALILGAAYIFCVSGVLLIFAVCAPKSLRNSCR